jgi:hypothetical protein
VLSEVKS